MIETYLQIPDRRPWEKLTSLNEMRPHSFVRLVPSVPFDNLCPTGGPHTLMAHHVAQSVIEKADTERLADDPGVQVQYQEPAVLFAVPIQDVKTLLEEFAIAVHRHVPLPERVY